MCGLFLLTLLSSLHEIETTGQSLVLLQQNFRTLAQAQTGALNTHLKGIILAAEFEGKLPALAGKVIVVFLLHDLITLAREAFDARSIDNDDITAVIVNHSLLPQAVGRDADTGATHPQHAR